MGEVVRHPAWFAVVTAFGILGAASPVGSSPYVLISGAQAAQAKAPHKGAPGGKTKKQPPNAQSKRDHAIKTSILASDVASQYTSCEAFRDDHDNWVGSNVFESVIGSDIGRNLAEVNLEKGEYETTAEWQDRTWKTAGLFVGNPGRMTFLINVPDENQRYDADAGSLTITVPTDDPIVAVSSTYGKYLPIRVVQKKVGSTLGRTRMGIRFRYESWIRYEQFISVSSERFAAVFGKPGSSSYSSDTAVSISVPRDAALRLRGKLQIAILAAFVPPFADRDDDDDVASLDDPVELYTRSEVWSVDPRCAYLYDAAAHTILHTYYTSDIPA